MLQRKNNFISFFYANYLYFQIILYSLIYIIGISSLIPLAAHHALVRSESLCPLDEGNSWHPYWLNI